MKVNEYAYRELVAADLTWLLAQPRTLERDHIEAILVDTIRFYYPGGDVAAESVARESERGK